MLVERREEKRREEKRREEKRREEKRREEKRREEKRREERREERKEPDNAIRTSEEGTFIKFNHCINRLGMARESVTVLLTK